MPSTKKSKSTIIPIKLKRSTANLNKSPAKQGQTQKQLENIGLLIRDPDKYYSDKVAASEQQRREAHEKSTASAKHNAPKTLESLYASPEYGSFGFTQFWNAVKSLEIKDSDGKRLTYKRVKDFYASKAENQIYKRPIKVSKYMHIQAPGPGSVQVDLMDMSRYAKTNKGIMFLLVVVDVYSRFCWVFPLKNKSAKNIAEALDHLITTWPEIDQRKFISDHGTEFLGPVDELLTKNGWERKTYDLKNPFNKHSTGIVERMNLTIWQMLRKHMAKNETNKYLDSLNAMIDGYNQKTHPALSASPVEVLLKGVTPIRVEQMRELTNKDNVSAPQKVNYDNQKYKAGDNVRYMKNRQYTNPLGKKSLMSTYSKKIHKVKAYRNGRYVLDNGLTFMEQQLIPGSGSSQETKKSLDAIDAEERQFERRAQREIGIPVKAIDKKLIIGDNPRPGYGNRPTRKRSSTRRLRY